MNFVFKLDRVAIVERVLKGKDYRIVVLDDKIISAYQRLPLNVIGDGRSSVRDLLLAKQRQFEKSGRDTVLKFNDYRIKAKLNRSHLSFESILEKGRKISLLDNANLSSGGDSIDVTDNVHSGFAIIAIKLTKEMGLRLCGVDLMIEGDIKERPKKYHVIEINSAPGLDNYSRIGEKQARIVEELYLEIVRAME